MLMQPCREGAVAACQVEQRVLGRELKLLQNGVDDQVDLHRIYGPAPNGAPDLCPNIGSGAAAGVRVVVDPAHDTAPSASSGAARVRTRGVEPVRRVGLANSPRARQTVA